MPSYRGSPRASDIKRYVAPVREGPLVSASPPGPPDPPARPARRRTRGARAHGGTQSASMVVCSRPVPTEASRAQHKSERSRVGCDVVVAGRRGTPRKRLGGGGVGRGSRGCSRGSLRGGGRGAGTRGGRGGRRGGRRWGGARGGPFL